MPADASVLKNKLTSEFWLSLDTYTPYCHLSVVSVAVISLAGEVHGGVVDVKSSLDDTILLMPMSGPRVSSEHC